MHALAVIPSGATLVAAAVVAAAVGASFLAVVLRNLDFELRVLELRAEVRAIRRRHRARLRAEAQAADAASARRAA